MGGRRCVPMAPLVLPVDLQIVKAGTIVFRFGHSRIHAPMACLARLVAGELSVIA